MAWLYDCASRVRYRVPAESRLHQAGRGTVWLARSREEHGYRADVAEHKRRVRFGLAERWPPLGGMVQSWGEISTSLPVGRTFLSATGASGGQDCPPHRAVTQL